MIKKEKERKGTERFPQRVFVADDIGKKEIYQVGSQRVFVADDHWKRRVLSKLVPSACLWVTTIGKEEQKSRRKTGSNPIFKVLTGLSSLLPNKAVITAVITVPSSSNYRNYGFTVITVNVTTVIQDLTSGLTRDVLNSA